MFCAPLGRERGPTDDLVRAPEGRSKRHDTFQPLIITPSASLSTLLFEVPTPAFSAPIGILLRRKANPIGLATVGSHTRITQTILVP